MNYELVSFDTRGICVGATEIIVAVASTLIVEHIMLDYGSDDSVHMTESNLHNLNIPQLWSHHIVLNMDAKACAVKGKSIFELLGFTAIVQKDYFTYANFVGNRATIKCVDVSEKAFVYIAVAGDDVNTVEKIRNNIARQF